MHFSALEDRKFFAGRSIRRYEEKFPREENYFLEISQSLTSMKLWPISEKNLTRFSVISERLKLAEKPVFMRLGGNQENSKAPSMAKLIVASVQQAPLKRQIFL